MKPSTTLFLSGDVMTGRGIDQIMHHPESTILHEPFVKNAKQYVDLAESLNGKIPKPVNPEYIWGDALAEITNKNIDFRIINLETSVTTHNIFLDKGINYRMHPKNIDCLTIAKIDCCVLANNHVLDLEPAGLIETLDVLFKQKIKTAGAGLNLAQAEAPAILSRRDQNEEGRILVFAFGMSTAGIPRSWSATESQPGVHFLKDFSDGSLKNIGTLVQKYKKKNDIAIFSIHWGGNWGYDVLEAEQHFARNLIDQSYIDIVHGHSSHHFKGIEIYRKKLILYGCGDLINDYEGIEGYEQFRGDLSFLYFPEIDLSSGELITLRLVPMQIRKFCLNRVNPQDFSWISKIIEAESNKLGTKLGVNFYLE